MKSVVLTGYDHGNTVALNAECIVSVLPADPYRPNGSAVVTDTLGTRHRVRESVDTILGIAT